MQFLFKTFKRFLIYKRYVTVSLTLIKLQYPGFTGTPGPSTNIQKGSIFRISLSVPFCVSSSIYCCETNHSNLSGLEHSHYLSWVFGLAGHWTVFTRGFSCSYGQMSGRAVVIWRLEGAGQPSSSLV